MCPKIRESEAIPINTSTSNFCYFCKPRHKKILSSVSNIHNGHYIAATLSTLLSTITSTLCSIPWELGLTYERWKRLLNVALEKKLGKILLSALWTIHLLEADFNTATKMIFAQRAMNNAIAHNQMPASQYARKRSRPIKAVMLK